MNDFYAHTGRLLLFFLLIAGSTRAQTTYNQDFESNWGNSGYDTYSLTGSQGETWTIDQGYREADKVYAGSYACRLDDGGTQYLVSPEINGIGNLTFYYRHWDGSPSLDFSVEVSADGETWTEVTAFSSFANTAYQEFNHDINDAGASYVRIRSNGDERLIIDDVSASGYTASGVPEIANISQTPAASITSSDAVAVSADVTDSDGSLSTVELHWGTASGNLPNTIAMTADGDDTYTTDHNIPAQTDGTTVYYEIYAADNDGQTQSSFEQHYTVVDPAGIPFSESFDEAAVPNGWSFTDFTIATATNAGGSANEADLHYSNARPGKSNITSKPINTAGESALSLSWKQNLDFYENGSGTHYTVKVQTSSNGTNFSDVWSKTVTSDETGNQQINMDETDGVGDSTLYIRWLYADNSTNRFTRWAIDAIDLKVKTPPKEPSSHVANFSASQGEKQQMALTWKDNDGEQPAEGFLIKASNEDFSEIIAPADGTAVADNTDFSAGNGAVNVDHGVERYIWTGLQEQTGYYFRIYPYTNSGAAINYKTDGAVPEVKDSIGSTTAIAGYREMPAKVWPSGNTLNIHSTTSGNAFLQVHDITGRTVFQKQLKLYESRQKIPLSLQPGVYIVHLHVNGSSFSQKIMMSDEF